MEELLDIIRTALAPDASPETRAAGAQACRHLLAALEPQPTPAATPPGAAQLPIAELATAIKLDPKHADANYTLLRLAFSEKDQKEAARLINKLIADGHDGYSVRIKAADLAEIQKDAARQKQNLEAAAKHDPSQAEPLQGLYDLAKKQKDRAGQLVALKRLGREVEFVRIPEEDHNLSRTGKPSRRLARLHHLIGWFDAHL